jgi:flagellar biosynthetic protein FliP
MILQNETVHTSSLSVSDTLGLSFRKKLMLICNWFKIRRLLLLFGILFIITPQLSDTFAQALPKLTLSVNDNAKPSDVVVTLQILLLITVLALAPSIMILMTSFVRIIIVLSFLRRAIGTQTMPPDQIMVGLALFLTLFIMMPTFTQINQNAIQPYLDQKIEFREALKEAGNPVRNFMLRQVNEKDVALFVRISKMPLPRNVNDLPYEVIIPAFITSELKTAFIIGFILFIPFLVIDMIVASVLLSMGMMMLPPVMISMPFKIVLFVLVDGWHLIVRQLVVGFR